MTVERDIETVGFRPMRLGETEMPLADMGGFVASISQGLGQGVLSRVEVAAALGHEQRRVGGGFLLQLGLHGRGMADGRGDTVAGGVLPTEDRGPCGGAKRHRIGVREPHGLPREGVHVRSLVIPRTVSAAVHPAHVVDEEQHDVRLLRGRVGGVDRRERSESRVVRRSKVDFIMKPWGSLDVVSQPTAGPIRVDPCRGSCASNRVMKRLRRGLCKRRGGASALSTGNGPTDIRVTEIILPREAKREGQSATAHPGDDALARWRSRSCCRRCLPWCWGCGRRAGSPRR